MSRLKESYDQILIETSGKGFVMQGPWNVCYAYEGRYQIARKREDGTFEILKDRLGHLRLFKTRNKAWEKADQLNAKSATIAPKVDCSKGQLINFESRFKIPEAPLKAILELSRVERLTERDLEIFIVQVINATMAQVNDSPKGQSK